MFNCNFCGKSFKQVTGLKNHLNRVHPDKVKYDYVCQICGDGFNGIQHILSHITKKHKDISVIDYFNKFIYGSLKCKFCGDVLSYEKRFSGNFCNQQHYETYKRNLKGVVNYSCKICNNGYEKLGGLQLHLVQLHNFDKIQLEEYYKTNIWKDGDPDGNCLWCGSQLKWVSFTEGYNKFCYNKECNVKWYNQNTDRKKIAAKSLSETYLEDKSLLLMNKEYWIKKGFTEEEAKIKVKERQSTFSKEKCIEKFGEIEGMKRWQERQNKWQKKLNNKPIEEIERINRSKMGIKSFSKISQSLFWWLNELLKNKYKLIYFAENKNNEKNIFKNSEYMIHTINNTNRFLDFYIPEINKCIEFDGDYWHDINTVGNVERDRIREEEVIETLNCKIFHVKERDYRENSIKVINECMEFLNETN